MNKLRCLINVTIAQHNNFLFLNQINQILKRIMKNRGFENQFLSKLNQVKFEISCSGF